MRVRNDAIAAVIVTAITMSSARTAHAQGSTPAPAASAPTPAAASPTPVAAPASRVAITPARAPALPGDVRIYTPPAVLNAAWTRAVQCVLDGMKHLVDIEKLEAAETIGAQIVAARTSTPPPPVPAWQPAWAHANALREAVGPSPWELTPVSVAPPTESPADTRGQHALLLGARLWLPWMVP